MAEPGRSPSARAASLAHHTALTYLVVTAVSFAAVFGGLYALAATSPNPVHTVTFEETGLPSGTIWSVALGGVSETAMVAGTSSSIQFAEINGRYNFTVGAASGFTANPSGGAVVVNGQDVTVGVVFIPPMTPLGTAFAMGNPQLTTCPSGDSFAIDGCNGGDYAYLVTIESSTVEFGNVLFEVHTASGGNFSVLPGSGGFALTNVTGAAAAEINSTQMGNELWMSTNWLTYGSGYFPSTPLTNLFTIVVDVGTTDTAGIGLTLVAVGSGGYSGQTSPLSLP